VSFEVQINRGDGWTTEHLGLPSFDTRPEAEDEVAKQLERDGPHPCGYRIVEHDGRSAGWVVKTWPLPTKK
jgi:hypothetical protein